MSIHVAKKESSSKTFRPRGSSSVTKLMKNSFVTDEDPRGRKIFLLTVQNVCCPTASVFCTTCTSLAYPIS